MPSGASAPVIPATTSARAVSSPAESSCATIHGPYLSMMSDGRPSASPCTTRHALAAMPVRRAAAAEMRAVHHGASMDSLPRVRRRSRISELGE